MGVLSGGALLQQEKLRENKRQLKGEGEREREREREVTCCWIFRTILCVICYNLIKKDRKSRLLMLIVGCNK